MTDPRIYKIDEPDVEFSNLTKQYDYMRVYESSSGGQRLSTKQKTLNFRILDNQNLLSLSESYLCLRLVVSSSGGAYNGDETLSLSNGSSIFRRCRLLVGGATVEQVDDNFMHLHNWENVVGNHPEALEELYVPQKSSSLHTEIAAPLAILQANDVRPHLNTSLLLRSKEVGLGFGADATVANSSLVTVTIPLSKLFMFIKNNNSVMSNLNVEIELELVSTDAEMWVSPTTTLAFHPSEDVRTTATLQGYAAITDTPTWEWSQSAPAFLLVKRVLPTNDEETRIRTAINKGLKLSKTFLSRRIYKSASPVGQQSWRIATMVNTVVAVHVFFQFKDRRNRFFWETSGADHCGVEYVSIMKNGILQTVNRYEPKFSASTFASSSGQIASSEYEYAAGPPVHYIPSNRKGAASGVQTDVQLERKRMHREFVKITGADMSYDDYMNLFPVYSAICTNDDERVGSSELVIDYSRLDSVNTDLAAIVGPPAYPAMPGSSALVDIYCIVEYLTRANIAMSQYETSIVVA